ncbi:putative oxidoreductase [Rubricella aquisinus]|uniref:Putative oxidoreductase n=1 Tax=Rubricella aquisinus TaxID=2028108 RepID=A0A840WXG0_9RHOB|nr:aldo/keto reductase [Rubricella aquisinus]MBB5515044.1 putative oxidoreductase [Rubricella aquisinus]
MLTPTCHIGALEVNRLGYGCWRFAGSSLRDAAAKVGAALDAGMTLFDTAPIYGFGAEGFGDAEARLGDVFAADPALRGQVTLVTKAGITPPMPYDSRAAHLLDSCEASLRRLRTDVIDLFLIHRPDFLTHPAQVADGLTRLRAAGKVREVGVSNYTPAQARALQAHLDFPLAATQPEFSAAHTVPLYDGTLDHAMEAGMAVMAWSPLAGGALATGQGDPALTAKLAEVAQAHESRPDLVALAWVLMHPSLPIALIGSQNPARITASADVWSLNLSRAEWYAILEASLGERMP